MPQDLGKTPGPTVRCDVAIIGGGVAGLWTRHALRAAGYSIVLLEAWALGAGQTVASQGILHSGVKYAFSRAAERAAGELLMAQGAWLDALEGRAGPDLRSVRVLARSMHLWTQPGLLSRFTGVLASRAMRSQVERLGSADRPGAFVGAPENVAVWRVDERAVDAPTLAAALRQSADGPLVLLDHGDKVGIEPGPGRVGLNFRTGGRATRLEVGALVLAAGQGNESLLRAAAIDPLPICQRRPLHMVMVRDAPEELFGHCIQELSDKPRLTVTTAPHDGGRVWYIGGTLAETGVVRSRDEQIGAARAELGACLPWLDTGARRMSTFRIDRAEGKTAGGQRPDGPVVHARGRVVAVWPTKLALAPRAASLVVEAVQGLGLPVTAGEIGGLDGAASPGIASPPWAAKDIAWT